MGTSDLFCAICGGPLRKVDIAGDNRSEAFKAAVAQGEEPPDWDEARTYDPEIIYDDFAAWTENAGILGFNPTIQGRDQ